MLCFLDSVAITFHSFHLSSPPPSNPSCDFYIVVVAAAIILTVNFETNYTAFNYWAICNDNINTYLGTKEPNYFMGPTLYDSSKENRNLVNRLGEVCREEEPCFFLHADMCKCDYDQ